MGQASGTRRELNLISNHMVIKEMKVTYSSRIILLRCPDLLQVLLNHTAYGFVFLVGHSSAEVKSGLGRVSHFVQRLASLHTHSRLWIAETLGHDLKDMFKVLGPQIVTVR